MLGALLGWLLLLPALSYATASPGELLDGGRIDDVIHLLTPQDWNHAEAFNYLCRADSALGDWDTAVQNCERAAQLEPGNAIFQLWLGRSYGEKG